MEAVLEAAVLRLRPILMTTFATVLGVVPLLLAFGAGANSRFAIGLTISRAWPWAPFYPLCFTHFLLILGRADLEILSNP